jgi:arylsulfatase A-like enzyme
LDPRRDKARQKAASGSRRRPARPAERGRHRSRPIHCFDQHPATDRFKGRSDIGYEAIRETIPARQKELGIVPSGTELPPVKPIGTPEVATIRTANRSHRWTSPPLGSLSTDQRRLFARTAEMYAGFLAHVDHDIGRLLDYLERNDYVDNTMIVVVSDNGASGEGGPNGSVNEMKTADPCIISWPAGTKARGEVRHWCLHPTVVGQEVFHGSKVRVVQLGFAIASLASAERLKRVLTGTELGVTVYFQPVLPVHAVPSL